MDELSNLSPASRERNLDELPRKELQQLAKEAGVKGNIKSKEIVQSLLRCLEGGEAVPGTSVKARSTFQALARADTAGSAGSDASQPDKAIAFSAALAEAAAQADDSGSHVAPDQDVANATKADKQDQSLASASEILQPPVILPEDQSALPQAPTITARLPEEAGISGAETSDGHTLTSIDARNSDAPRNAAATEERTDQDCIGNPLYEEPDPVRPVPMPVVNEPGLQPAQSALPTAASVQMGASGLAMEHVHEGVVDQNNALEAGAKPAASVGMNDPGTSTVMQGSTAANMTEEDLRPMSDPQMPAIQSVYAVNAATVDEAQPMQEDTAEKAVKPVCDVNTSLGEEQLRREATPEELANLGKAVDMVQARSCQLSPSLLTVGQSPAGMDSPARDAFERGRKSGIWQGSTEVELQQLERQWDDYKSIATRGWDLPNLQDVQAKSDALEASGFATVHSPLLSKATKDAMAQQGVKSGKRKACSEVKEQSMAASKAPGQSRKVVKRAQGHTPSRKAPAPGLRGQSPAQKGPGPSPLRHLNGNRSVQGPSRLAQSTHVSDIENAAKAANTFEGKADASEGKAATPLPAGVSQRDINTGVKAVKATAIPKPRPAVDRAKKAEATFAARRAAALAKVKK